MSRPQDMNYRAPIAGLAIFGATALAAACGSSGADSLSTGTTGPNNGSPPSLNLGSCGTTNALFTVSPVALTDVLGWVPLGNLGPPGHLFPTDHQYLYVNHPGDKTTIRQVNVVSPGNITITRAHRTHYSDSNTFDYAFEFYPCDEVRAEFGHVTTIEPSVLAQMGAFDQECASYGLGLGTNVTFDNCWTKSIAVKVKAGDALGTTGGQGTSFALDFSLFDRRLTPMVVANASRWEGGQDHRKAAPASDYFSEPARSAIRAKLGTFDGRDHRVVEPVGGTIAVDVPGSGQGIWVNPSQPLYPESPHLALVPENIDPSRVSISMGLSQPGFAAGLYRIVPTSSGFVDRHPSQITPDGKLYCFQFFQSQGVLLVKMEDANTLRVEGRQTLTTCAAEEPWAFGASSFVYKR